MQYLLNLLLVGVFVASTTFISNEVRAISSCDELCKSMFVLNPQGNIRTYSELSRELHKYPTLDPYLAIAIAYQESTLGDRMVSSRGTDFGLFQFHESTIKRRNLSTTRLLTDVSYNVRAYSLIMKRKLAMCSRTFPLTAYACWHSSTPSKHEAYARKITAHLLKMKHAATAATK